MATVEQRINAWKTGEVRGASQVNNTVALNRYNKGLLIFQKELLEYVANQAQVTSINIATVAGQDTYALPFGTTLGLPTDFYSIAQLRIADELDKDGYPKYRVCEALNIGEYNITQKGKSIGEPYIVRRISHRHPRYSFINKYESGSTQTYIKVYPTPTQSIPLEQGGGISLQFNYINEPVEIGTDEAKLALPWYFLDVIDDYLSYRLMLVENPELAQTYYNTFINTLHNNIYGLNRDQRPVEENFADLSALYHN